MKTKWKVFLCSSSLPYQPHRSHCHIWWSAFLLLLRPCRVCLFTHRTSKNRTDEGANGPFATPANLQVWNRKFAPCEMGLKQKKHYLKTFPSFLSFFFFLFFFNLLGEDTKYSEHAYRLAICSESLRAARSSIPCVVNRRMQQVGLTTCLAKYHVQIRTMCLLAAICRDYSLTFIRGLP